MALLARPLPPSTILATLANCFSILITIITCLSCKVSKVVIHQRTRTAMKRCSQAANKRPKLGSNNAAKVLLLLHFNGTFLPFYQHRFFLIITCVFNSSFFARILYFCIRFCFATFLNCIFSAELQNKSQIGRSRFFMMWLCLLSLFVLSAQTFNLQKYYLFKQEGLKLRLSSAEVQNCKILLSDIIVRIVQRLSFLRFYVNTSVNVV